MRPTDQAATPDTQLHTVTGPSFVSVLVLSDGEVITHSTNIAAGRDNAADRALTPH